MTGTAESVRTDIACGVMGLLSLTSIGIDAGTGQKQNTYQCTIHGFKLVMRSEHIS